MPARPEPVHGGLVTSRDASLLEPGELQVAEDVVLLPGSPTLQKAPGRRVFNAISPGTIDGIAYCDFDSVADKVVVVAGGTYHRATAGEEGNFVAGAPGAGDSLEAISVEDKVVLLSGGTHNQVLLPDGSFRPHGLKPVTAAPGLVHTATGGTWALGAASVPGFYEYWTTEVYKATDDEVESTFSGTTSTIEVTTITSFVTVNRPHVTNPSATHWRCYRSNKKTSFFDAQFPLGFLIAELPINTVSFDDGKTTATDFTLPTVATAPTSIPDSLKNRISTSPNQTIVVAPWPSPENILADDTTNATSASVSTVAGGGVATKTVSVIFADTFGAPFSAIGSPITNIQVRVDGSRTASTLLIVYLSPDNGQTWTSGRNIPLETAITTKTIDSFQWGRTWNGAEFANGSFRMALVAEGPLNAGTGTIKIDYVSVSVTHSGSTAQQVIVFPAVELIVGGERVPIGANGETPISDTGDLFQGSILMNDLEKPTNIVWTIPGTIDYVPVPYRLAIDDRVTCIRALGTSALIGGEGTVERMNYLPVAEDPEFSTGRARDLLDSDDGMVSNKAAVRFVLNGVLHLFYIGQTTLRMTEGYQVQTATDDIVWRTLVDQPNIKKCFCENNAALREILVYYPSAGSATVNKKLRLSYDTTHIKNGKLKVVGITNYGPKAAAAGVLHTTGERILYTAKGGTVYVENRGFEDESGGGIRPNVSTREMHLAGLGNSSEVSNFAVHTQGGGPMTISARATLANNPDSSTQPQTFAMPRRGTIYTGTPISGDGITYNLSGADDGLPWSIDYLLLYGPDLGESAPLKS